MKEQTLADLEAELAVAAAHHADAKQRESMARTVATDALNKLNDVQKKVTARFAELQAKADRDSDWKRITTRGEVCL